MYKNTKTAADSCGFLNLKHKNARIAADSCANAHKLPRIPADSLILCTVKRIAADSEVYNKKLQQNLADLLCFNHRI